MSETVFRAEAEGSLPDSARPFLLFIDIVDAVAARLPTLRRPTIRVAGFRTERVPRTSGKVDPVVSRGERPSPAEVSSGGAAMRVRDLLSKKRSTVITVGPDEKIGRAVRLLMEHHIGGLPIAGGSGELLGFVAERDIVRLADLSFQPLREVPVRQAMRSPAPTCSTDDSVRDVMSRMTRERARHLVALDDGRIAGVISVGDLLKERLEELEAEAGVLRDYAAARRAATSRRVGG